MLIRKFYRFGLAGLILLILVSVVSAVAASNTVPPSRLADRRSPIGPNSLKPAECAALTLTNIVVCPSGGGACNGTNAADLILGSPAIDDIQGDKGNDCILGGGGDDTIRGDQGTDVCDGGPGNDSFHPTCETQNQ
jgi:hypothetical protein